MTAPNSTPTEEPTGNRGPERDRKGRFSQGNVASLRHGRYSKAVAGALLPEQLLVLQVLQAHEDAILVDLGGRDSLSTFERDAVTRYEQLGRVADFNAARMLSPKPALRREGREAFMAAIDRQLKIIGLLGLARRQKDIGSMSAAEYHQHLAEQEGTINDARSLDSESGEPGETQRDQQ